MLADGFISTVSCAPRFISTSLLSALYLNAVSAFHNADTLYSEQCTLIVQCVVCIYTTCSESLMCCVMPTKLILLLYQTGFEGRINSTQRFNIFSPPLKERVWDQVNWESANYTPPKEYFGAKTMYLSLKIVGSGNSALLYKGHRCQHSMFQTDVEQPNKLFNAQCSACTCSP